LSIVVGLGIFIHKKEKDLVSIKVPQGYVVEVSDPSTPLRINSTIMP
jgi:hypothetical protein